MVELENAGQGWKIGLLDLLRQERGIFLLEILYDGENMDLELEGSLLEGF